MPIPVLRRSLFLAPALIAAGLLSGCSTLQTPVTSSAAAGVTLNGHVIGGQPPVTGAHVYLYAANTTSYGGASTSLLTTGLPGVTTDVNGNGYVTTDANGNFGITGDYSCPNGSQAYLLAVGGNPGLTAGSSNNALTLTAALGACGSFGPTTSIVINELSTAAMVTALQQFMVDSTHIGAGATDATGFANAFAEVPNLVGLGTGMARTTTTLGNGTVPQSKLNLLGDILSPCVNSASRTSSACTALFTAATPQGGVAPTDVTSAMLLIAQNPAINPTGLFNLTDANAPFQPKLTSVPNDLSIGITYTGGGLSAPGFVAIDAAGNAWTANCPTCLGASGTDSIVGFSPAGAVLSGAGGYTAGIHKPQGLAFDSGGNLWSTDSAAGSTPDQVVKQTSAGALQFAFNDATIGGPLGIAIDSGNNAWVANSSLSNLVKVNAAGTRTQAPVTSAGFSVPNGVALDTYGVVYAAGSGSNSILTFSGNGTLNSPAGGYTGGGLSQPIGIAIDGGDNLWTVDNGSSGVSVLHGYNGGALAGSPYFVGLSNANVVAIDGSGSAWIANCRSACGDNSGKGDDVVHLSGTGAIIGGQNGLQDPNFARVGVAAIDGSGNLWVTNNGGGSITKLLGVAAPVVTPLAVSVSRNRLGQHP